MVGKNSFVTFIGHATTFIQMNGTRLLTDPVLRSRVLHLKNRYPPVMDDILNNVDAVLISHVHFDHLDLPSLRILGMDTPLIVPKGAGYFLARQGFQCVQEVSVGQKTWVGNLLVEATYAEHDRRRYPMGLEVEDSLGFVVRGPYSIYFAGDTDIYPEMDQIGDLDLALLPVWGWGPTLGRGHMDPVQAVQALKLLQPRSAVPIHWGSLYPTGLNRPPFRFLFDPPHVFKHFAAHHTPKINVEIVPPGEGVQLGELVEV